MKKLTDNMIPVAPSLPEMIKKDNPTTSKRVVTKRIVYLSLQAIFNALVIGYIAKLLVALIDLVTNIAFYGRFSFAHASPENNHLGLWVIAVPVIGGILVGLIARFGSKAIRGHGIPEAMEKIISGDSKIPFIITFLKPFSAAIAIGTGGPFGAEGPIIATGGAFGSLTGQIMHISANERKIILAAGACAGMSAIFGSPLAAVLLAIELLLFEFSPRSIIPVALACATGAAMHMALFDSRPVFAMAAIPHVGIAALGIYTLFGVIIGVVAALISKSVYAVEDLFEKLPIHWMLWPAIGGIAIGVIGIFAPYTMGVGYSNIEHLLDGQLPLSILFGLLFLKYVSWVISLGSGTSGGTLAPLFTIGGALGALLGIFTLRLFPGLGINIATASLIGMAALFTGASRAFLTSIVFSIETTAQPNALMPLLAACSAAYFISFFLMKGTIMTEKIQRRGVKTPDEFLPDPFHAVTVKELMVETRSLPLQGDLFVYPGNDVSLAMELMGKHYVDTLAVVAENNTHTIIGKIDMAAIAQYYSSSRQKEHAYHSPAYVQSKRRKMLVKTKRLMQKMKR